MKKMLFLMTAIVLVMGSCASSKQISYTVADHYFVNNNAPEQTSLKYTSQQQFDQTFGMAAVMGRNGLPTKIDFQRQFVIAKVLPITNVDTEMRPLALTETADGQLEFSYEVISGQEMSSSMQPCLLLIVDRKYVSKDIVEKRVDRSR